MMSLWRAVTRGIRAMFDRGADRRVDDEIQSFIDEAAAAHEADGLTPAEAARAARQRVGNPLSVREEVRASGWEHVLETLAGDLRYGIRGLARDRGFAAVTISTLALGIGSATVILSVATPVFVQTLPFPNAARIHAIWDQGQDRSRVEVTYGTFLEVQRRSRAFEQVAVARVWQPTLAGGSTPERLEGRAVTAGYFDVFGMAPRIGRGFVADDDRPNAARVAIISDRLWRRRFDADPTAVGRQVTLDGAPHEVVGILPQAFEHRLMPPADVWRPLQYDATLPNPMGREWGHHLRMVGALRSGRSRAEALAELNQMARDPVPAFRRPRWADLSQGLAIDPLHDELTRDARPAMLAITAAATLLLLIACVNVVNLLLARNARRHAELSMRTALGAGRGRLIRQLLTETLVLAGLGGMAGLALAQVALGAVTALGPDGVPPVIGAVIDTPVFATAFAVTAIVGVLVGLAPAFSSRGLKAGLPQGTRHTRSPHQAMRRSLVVAEVAFALVLLAGAGLLFRSVRELFAIAPGFIAGNVMTMQVQVSGAQFGDTPAIHRFFSSALERVKAVPGVTNAGLTSLLPLSGSSDVYGLQFESSDTSGATDGAAFRYAVTPDYLDTMGLRMRRGRFISEHDGSNVPPVVVVNEAFAERRYPGIDPIGQRLHIGPTDRPWYTIVGVVNDVKQMSLEEEAVNAVYIAPAQWHFADRAFWFVIRTAGDPAALTAALREAIWTVDRDQAIVRVSPLTSVVAATARERSFALLLFEVFGASALLLTTIGIYGVVAAGVTDRMRELGVRTALGASRQHIVRMVLGQGLALSMAGVAIGLAVAAIASRGLRSLLYGVSPLDPASYGAVAAVLLLAAMAASWLPAHRAARIDPAITLRAE